MSDTLPEIHPHTLMILADIDSELRGGKLRPVYIFYGPERFPIQTTLGIIRQFFSKQGVEPDRFTAGVHPLSHIMGTLRTPNLLAPKRLVIVDEVDDFKKEDWDSLREYAENPVPEAVLLLIGTSIGAAVARGWPVTASLLESKSLYPNQVPGWINMEARRMGIKISMEAAQMLSDAVGSDLGSLSQALEKLTLFAGKTALITPEAVQKIVGVSREENVFALTRALGDRNAAKAVLSLKHLLEQGEMPVRVLGMVARNVRLLAKAQALLQEGCSERDLASKLKVHPFFVKEYVSQARQWPKEGWSRRFRQLYTCDRSLKSSPIRGSAILEKTIWKLVT